MNTNLPAQGGGRHDAVDAPSVLAFIADAATEQVLRDGLGSSPANGLDIRRGNVRTAIAAMAKLKTPEILIVDISGEEQPLAALAELAEFVEPGVILLAIGVNDDISFYRHITHGLGVMEYIFKPINRDAVARFFGPYITHKAINADSGRGGRVIAVIGSRPGVGATTIAANLAWYLGVTEKRHTVYIESDLYTGSGALLLGATAGPGLRMALEAPDRIDPLFVERAAQSVKGRLSVLASQEKLTSPVNYAPGAAGRLIEALRSRYNFIILDVPFLPAPYNQELLSFTHHRIIVTDPSLAGIRDTLRLLEVPNGVWQPQRPTIVLNRQGRPGALTAHQIEAESTVKFDVVIPDLPAQLNESANLGEPAVVQAGQFRDAIRKLSVEAGFIAGHDDPTAVIDKISNLCRLLSGLLLRPGRWTDDYD